MGQSRSATITLVYLMLKGMNLDEAYNHVHNVGPFVEPNGRFWNSKTICETILSLSFS